MPEQPRSIIAGTEAEHGRRRRRRPPPRPRRSRRTAPPRPTQRGDFLDAVAAEIEADKDAIVEAAVAESNLPEARIAGEVGRTTRTAADVRRRRTTR